MRLYQGFPEGHFDWPSQVGYLFWVTIFGGNVGQDFLAIDFETANYEGDSACSIGLVKVKNGKITEQEVFLIQPPSREFVFTYLHGISWGQVAKAPTFGKLWPKLKALFEGVEFLVAHNASFDRRVLFACCARYDISPPALPFNCTMQLARRHFGIYPTKLSDVCRRLRIQLNHHEALSDARAAAKIMLAVLNKTGTGSQTIEKKFQSWRHSHEASR